MRGHVVASGAAAAILLIALSTPALAQRIEDRMVLTSGVACRTAPETDAAIERRFLVGELVAPAEATVVEGATWYRDASRARAGSTGCWIYGPLTVAWDRARPETALLAAADHILARTDQPSFVEWVAVDNLLRRGTAQYTFADARDMSPLVALRRLQVVEGAARSPDAQAPSVLDDPFRLAWMIDRGDVLRFFEPAGGWLMEADVYWQLYERHRDTDAADEIAWTAAHGVVLADECRASCRLAGVQATWGRYWRERPAGAHVTEAVQNALEPVTSVDRRDCERDDDPGRARTLARELLASLAPVSVPQKSALEDQLRRLERECGA